MCEIDKSDLATELQLLLPSPFNLPVQENHEKQDHLIKLKLFPVEILMKYSICQKPKESKDLVPWKMGEEGLVLRER